MNLYWPNMYTVKADGKIERYCTYQPVHTTEKAVEQISKYWIENLAEGERPIISWIGVTDGSDNTQIIRKIEYGAHYYNKKYDGEEVTE